MDEISLKFSFNSGHLRQSRNPSLSLMMNYIKLFPKDHCFSTVCNASSTSFSPSAHCWLDYNLESRIIPAGDSLDFAGLLIQHKADFIAADQTWFSCLPISLSVCVCDCVCAFREVKVWLVSLVQLVSVCRDRNYTILLHHLFFYWWPTQSSNFFFLCEQHLHTQIIFFAILYIWKSGK